MILIVMGISGCGKTTVGSAVAKHLGWSFLDADDAHPEQNKWKMAQGVPLTDEDRIPWLLTLHEHINTCRQHQINTVVTCSALKQIYRKTLLHGRSTDWDLLHENSSMHPVTDGNGDWTDVSSTNPQLVLQSTSRADGFTSEVQQRISVSDADCMHSQVTFVYLKASYEVISRRLQCRRDHFMPATLLQSQLETLEEPTPDENVITINVDQSVEEILNDVMKRINM